MPKLLFSLFFIFAAYSAAAIDLLKQANIDYLGMVKKVQVIQETPVNKILKYVHLRAYTDENSTSEYLETIYLLKNNEELISKIVSTGEIRHTDYVSNYLGEISSVKVSGKDLLTVTQTSSGKVYLSLYKRANKKHKLIKLTLIHNGETKVLIDNTPAKTDFLREAILDYMFIDSVTDFRIVKKILSHDGTKTYVHGRAISPTKFDDPKWWDAVYVVENSTGKILTRLIDGNVVAGDNNLRYFMGQVESISLTKSGFLEVIQGPSRLKDKNYSIVTYKDYRDYMKIISIEVINEDGLRFKSQ